MVQLDSEESDVEQAPSPGAPIRNRRAFLGLAAGIAGAAGVSGALAACSPSPKSATGPLSPPHNPKAVRVASVYIPITSGLMDALIKGFAPSSGGLTVTTSGGADVLTKARDGQVDLVICHYGHTDDPGSYSLENFMDAGLGSWPRAVFYSQAVLVGPPADPAKISGLDDMVQAFKHIASSGVPFVVDNTDWLPYLGDCIVDAAGLTKGSWYVDLGSKAHQALADTEARNGYTMWGGVPFWSDSNSSQTSLVPMVFADPSLQRMMMSIVVNPEKVTGVNAQGATTFQEYLLTPAAQGTVRAFRISGFDYPLFWPAGGQNDPFSFPPGTQPSEFAQDDSGPSSGPGSGG